MFDLFRMEQVAQLFQFLNDLGVAVENIHALEELNAVNKFTLFH